MNPDPWMMLFEILMSVGGHEGMPTHFGAVIATAHHSTFVVTIWPFKHTQPQTAVVYQLYLYLYNLLS